MVGGSTENCAVTDSRAATFSESKPSIAHGRFSHPVLGLLLDGGEFPTQAYVCETPQGSVET